MKINLKPIETAPVGTEILLVWKDLDHFENGTKYDDGDGENPVYFVLFDGDSMHFPPTHWAELPEFTY